MTRFVSYRPQGNRAGFLLHIDIRTQESFAVGKREQTFRTTEKLSKMSGGSIAYGSSYLGDGKVGISKQVFSVINLRPQDYPVNLSVYADYAFFIIINLL